MKHRACPAGFTLVEMIATLAIMALLATAAFPLAEGISRHTKEVALGKALRDIRAALDQYKEAVSTGRIASETHSGYPPDLQVLVNGVADRSVNGKTLYFLRSIPRDPFCDAAFKDIDCWALRSYDSPPDAPAPGDDVFDVHSKSPETGSDGRPYRKW